MSLLLLRGKGKTRTNVKDNAETQRALSFAEKGGQRVWSAEAVATACVGAVAPEP